MEIENTHICWPVQWVSGFWKYQFSQISSHTVRNRNFLDFSVPKLKMQWSETGKSLNHNNTAPFSLVSPDYTQAKIMKTGFGSYSCCVLLDLDTTATTDRVITNVFVIRANLSLNVAESRTSSKASQSGLHATFSKRKLAPVANYSNRVTENASLYSILDILVLCPW